jgi:hypothetical protein
MVLRISLCQRLNHFACSSAIERLPFVTFSREKWELNNDDVELLEKIGRGNFGDVYRANLRDAMMTDIPVAVKTCKVIQVASYSIKCVS